MKEGRKEGGKGGKEERGKGGKEEGREGGREGGREEEKKKNCLKQADVNKSDSRKTSFQKSIRQFGPCACKSKLLQL